MAIIELPPEAIGLTPADIGVEAFTDEEVVPQVDSFIETETSKARIEADRFINDYSVPELSIVKPGAAYNENQQKSQEV